MANIFNSNTFGSNNQGSNNPFISNNQTQQNNIFQPNSNNGNPFSSNQQPQSNMFQNNQQGNNNVFGSNNQQQQGGSIFGGNQQQGGSIFGNNQPQGNQGNNIFGSNQNQGGNIFGNNQATNQGNIFGNNQNSNIFLNNQANQGNQGNNIFGNNQQQSNLLAQNQQQNNMFNNQGNRMFNNQGNQGYGAFNNQQNQVGANPFNNANGQPYSNQSFQNQPNFMAGGLGQGGFNLTATQVVENNNKVLEQQLKMMGAMIIQVEKCKLSENNQYRNIKVNSMPELKGGALTIRRQINQLKQHVRCIKNKRKQLQKEECTYIESTRDKLREYKEVLTQRLSQDSMIEGVREDINQISTEIQSFFKPMINAYKREDSISFIDPGDFELELVKKVSKKMDAIWDRVCEMQACQNADKSVDCSTIETFEQLLEYFQNVSLLFKDFVRKYSDMKKELIQRNNRGSYQEVMRQIDKERIASMGKGFKHYEILKNISSVIDEKEKRQKEGLYKTTERQKPRYYQRVI